MRLRIVRGCNTSGCIALINPNWVVRNVATSWRRRASATDFFRHLQWLYSHQIRKGHEWNIAFRYPPPLDTIRLCVRGNAGADSFIFSEVFEHEYYRLPIAAPATILDLGANIGMTSVYFGRLYPQAQIACVEPIPDNVRLLRKNLDMNSIRAKVFPAAVDVRDGEVVMEIDSSDYGHRITDPSSGRAGATLTVPALSVDSILRELGWDRVGLLKVDIEGHEKSLLSGDCDWLNRVDAMCIECHEGFGEADLRRLAKQFGFVPPVLLPGIWFLTRSPSAAGA